MKTRYLLPFVALSAALAQGPRMPPGPPRLDALKTYLSLTDNQVQGFKQIAQQTRTTVQPLEQQIRTKSQALQTLRRQGSADATALGNLVVEIDNLRKQVSDARAAAHTQALGVLTADQKTKLAALEEAAKLFPAAREAGALGLIQPPPGARMGPRMGPGMGPGMGPMARRMMRNR